MDSLPLDVSHPAIRDYVSLIRLQVLTPLSLLVSIATTVICYNVVHPSLKGISRLNPTTISPRPGVISTYVFAIYLFQIGYCAMLIMSRKMETKQTFIKGVGFPLIFANWNFAAWSIAFVFEYFLIATILQASLLVFLIYANLALFIYHPPVRSRPLDTAFIHAPLRFFLILPLSLLFPITLFIQLGLTHSPIPNIPGFLPLANLALGNPQQGGRPGQDYSNHQWAGFAVVLLSNLIGTVVIFKRRDFVWAVAATWICVSIWSERPKPLPVYVTVIAFTILHPITLGVGFVYKWMYGAEETQGAVRLTDDHEDEQGNMRAGEVGVVAAENGNHYQPPAPRVEEPVQRRESRELDAEAIWG